MNNKFEALKDDSETEDEEEETKHDEITHLVPLPTQKVECPEGEHRLNYNYSLWFSKKPQTKVQNQSYYQNLKHVTTLPSVERFWAYYSHLARPNDIGGQADYHLFKEGIRPMWEDEANRNGGKWIIRLKKGLSSRCWENLIFAMLGEQFMVGDEICGAVISIRFQEDILSLWNRSSSDTVVTSRIRDTLKRVLNLPPNTIMEYKTHNDSIKDNSSYRNTDIFMK